MTLCGCFCVFISKSFCPGYESALYLWGDSGLPAKACGQSVLLPLFHLYNCAIVYFFVFFDNFVYLCNCLFLSIIALYLWLKVWGDYDWGKGSRPKCPRGLAAAFVYLYFTYICISCNCICVPLTQSLRWQWRHRLVAKVSRGGRQLPVASCQVLSFLLAPLALRILALHYLESISWI